MKKAVGSGVGSPDPDPLVRGTNPGIRNQNVTDPHTAANALVIGAFPIVFYLVGITCVPIQKHLSCGSESLNLKSRGWSKILLSFNRKFFAKS
jgi:hypothetical protein